MWKLSKVPKVLNHQVLTQGICPPVIFADIIIYIIYVINLILSVYSQPQKYFGTEAETTDVDTFINQHSSKSNLMIIITKFSEFLCTKWNQEWPKGMSDIYLQAYVFMR